ncbi:MAG: helix-turn-helix domain-containing protein [Halioglobus sp.]
MDNTTEIVQRMAMAKALYSSLCGADIDLKTRSLAASYSKNLFTTPWRDQSETTTRVYGKRFFNAVHEMGKMTHLADQWQSSFDENNTPRDPDQARAFITEFFRLHLHYPRDYHNFVCQRRDIRNNGVMDFPIEHPISVDFWAVYITLEGSATLTVDNEATRLGPSSIAIIPPGCHCVLEKSDAAVHWVYDWLSFRSRLDWIELLGWATELTRPVFFATENSASFGFLTQQAEQLESQTYVPDTLSERLCNNIVENILLRLRLLAEEASGSDTQVNRKVQGAVYYILKHYGEDISLEMIADKVNSSPSRLSALFREHFGISVIKWRDHIRMQKAKELITHSHNPIVDVARRVGYPDALYFSRRFKDHFGVAPTHFRRIQGTMAVETE